MGFEYDNSGEEAARTRLTAPRTLQATIHHRPRSKARPRMSKSGHVYTPPETKAYEKMIREEWIKQCGNVPLTGALTVDIDFYFKRPKSHFDKNGSLHNAPKYFLNVPDLDNVEKAVLDALNKVAYADDKLIFGKRSTKNWHPSTDVILVTIKEVN